METTITSHLFPKALEDTEGCRSLSGRPSKQAGHIHVSVGHEACRKKGGG